MSLPAPVVGLVIRYSFLWSHQKAGGAAEGEERPCAIIVAKQVGPDGRVQVAVVPITHSPPGDTGASIEIPADVKARLDLDGERSWVRLDEVNRFVWPGYDLRPVPTKPNRWHYGRLPSGLYDEIRRGVLAHDKAGKAKVSARD